MKKIFISLVSLLVFTSCVLHVYRFTSVNYNNSRISISAGLVNSEDEKSPVEYIGVSDVRSNVNTPHKVKILSSTIKIITIIFFAIDIHLPYLLLHFLLFLVMVLLIFHLYQIFFCLNPI